jgi:hypothetical protein
MFGLSRDLFVSLVVAITLVTVLFFFAQIKSAYRRIVRERKMRRVLKRLARQYVSGVHWSHPSDSFSQRPDELTPQGLYIIIEDAVMPQDEGTLEALHTCILRGWIEQLPEKIRTKLRANDGRPIVDPQVWPYPMTHYRITESGWAAVNRAHAWTVARLLIGLLLGLLTLAGKLLLDAWSKGAL